MFRPLSLYIGLRHTRAKRSNHFVSFISLTSMIGIALGVAVLITVLSVMNGFDDHIRSKVFGMAPAITVTTATNQLTNWPTWQQKLATVPRVVAAAPYVDGQGLLRVDDQISGAEIQGIEPNEQNQIIPLKSKMILGKLDSLTPKSFNIVLGKDLANTLGVDLGDKVLLFIPQLTVSPAGVMPRYKRFTVSGIFSAGGGFGFDSGLAYINLQDAQALFSMGNTVTGLTIKINDMYQAPKVAYNINALYPQLSTNDWTQSYGPLFKAIAMEKTMMFLILILIIAVAAFNLVSGLVMMVTDKQAEIAILRTMGATRGMIMRIFMIQGALVGVLGTVLGTLGGALLAFNVTSIVNWLQKVLHAQLFQGSVYFLDYLPSDVKISDIVQIFIVALVLSFLATLYPAWRAARIQPAEALRYE